MNEPQEKMLGEQPPQPKANFNETSIAKILPISIGITVGIGFGPGIYKAIGETTGWGSVATFCVGTLILGVVGGFIGGIAQSVINVFVKEVKA